MVKEISISHFWVIKTVCVNEIQVPIVVKVKKRCTPGPVPETNSNRVSLVREFTASLVPVKAIK